MVSKTTSHRTEILTLIRPHWKPLTLALIAVLGETLADVLEPWPVKIVLDNLVIKKPLPDWAMAWLPGVFTHDAYAVLNFAIAAVAGIAVIGAISTFAEKYLTTSVSQWVGHDLRLSLYHHIQRLSLAEHDKTRTGDLITRVTDDTESVQDFITSALLGILVNVLTLVGMVGIMLWVNWRFTLIALSIAPLLFLVVYFSTRRIKAASRAVRKKQGEMLSGVAEVLGSIRVVQAFAREDFEEERFESESLENVKAGLTARALKARLPPMVDVIVACGTCLVLGYGARLAMQGTISAGMLVVFLLYLGKMYKPMRDLSKMTDTVSKAAVGYERIREVLDIESDVQDRPGARRAPRFKGEIALKQVVFSYGSEAPVLNDVSFAVKPGQVAAIVGPSGAGKSTIASLIARFYDPVSGVVTIDGTDIKQYTLKSLRDQISFVLQDNVLFNASIWDNIAYGNPQASSQAIMRAAKLANAQEFIEKLPEGYRTAVGERGVSLSGGQRQRIAIARGIVRDSPILILDEPTAALDAESEQAIVDALDRLLAQKTAIVIAHRLSTIRRADVIFVIQDAALVEQGTHDELTKKGGVYASLHQLQEQALEMKTGTSD
jgi:subfamily B ATP-binding cassette protein MsbA